MLFTECGRIVKPTAPNKAKRVILTDTVDSQLRDLSVIVYKVSQTVSISQKN